MTNLRAFGSSARRASATNAMVVSSGWAPFHGRCRTVTTTSGSAMGPRTLHVTGSSARDVERARAVATETMARYDQVPSCQRINAREGVDGVVELAAGIPSAGADL